MDPWPNHEEWKRLAELNSRPDEPTPWQVLRPTLSLIGFWLTVAAIMAAGTWVLVYLVGI